MAFYYTIDTETTGLPKGRGNPVPTLSTVSNWDKCRLLSVAIVSYDQNHNEISNYHKIIKPDGFEVCATHIHGITKEQADQEGIEFGYFIRELESFTESSLIFVGHNIIFDINVIHAELLRRNYSTHLIDKMTTICTLEMVKSRFIKVRKLSEVYKLITTHPLDGAHDALNDARACGEVYKYMVSNPMTFRDIGVSKIYVSVTDVAACMGMTPFKTPRDIMDKLQKRYVPEHFKGKTRDEVRSEVINQSTDLSQIVDKCIAGSSPETVSSVVNELIVNSNNYTLEQKTQAIDMIRETVNTQHGIQNESSVIDMLKTTTNNITRDETFYTYPLADIMGTKYILCGRIDGLEYTQDGSKRILEVKNRVRALFNRVRDYEMIQVQCYLKITGITSARLVESFNNTIKSYDITRNDDDWNKISEKMSDFCKALHSEISKN